MKNKFKYLDVTAKGVASFIMLQTLYFKFSASPESVYIFSTLGMEPLGRIGTGVGELIASALLLIPRTTWLGALGAIGLMSGAIFFHFTKLGIEVMNDGGQLFIYACLVLLCAGYLLIRNKQVPLALFNKGK
ncbi:MAG: DoxX family protein [Bacteroidia bacterium]